MASLLTQTGDYDLIVIGSGPGGYTAAIRGAQLGLKVAIVERELLGGICLNWGCIPTKALLKSGEVFAQLSHLGDYGLSATGVGFDMGKVVARSRGIAKQLNQGVAFLMKKNKVAVLEGAARLEKGSPAPRVVVAGKDGKTSTLQARHVILATGARAKEIAPVGLKSDGESVWTYRDAMVPKACPKSLLVVGSGAIGIEFGCFFNALGAKVTVVEALDRILPIEDAEVSAAARKAFEKRGMAFRTAAKVTGLTAGKDGVSLTLEAGGKSETLQAEKAIVAVGISANVEGIGLEALGVKLDRGHVVTDATCATNVPGLYAIGDVAGPPWLAHKAAHEGVLAAEVIAGAKRPHLASPVPGCTYSQPQVASIGMTEAQAKESGRSVKVGRFKFSANGKAIAAGETEGFVKTVWDGETGALLGAHMFGGEVTEMIQGFALVMTGELTEAEVFATTFPHPTLSEAMHEASLDAFGLVLNA